MDNEEGKWGLSMAELEKAQEERTWLVWRDCGSHHQPKRLVRLADDYRELPTGHGSVPYIVMVVYGRMRHAAHVQELRLATPNDMLKYGE